MLGNASLSSPEATAIKKASCASEQSKNLCTRQEHMFDFVVVCYLGFETNCTCSCMWGYIVTPFWRSQKVFLVEEEKLYILVLME